VEQPSRQMRRTYDSQILTPDTLSEHGAPTL
jgi:hypothetical protein